MQELPYVHVVAASSAGSTQVVHAFAGLTLDSIGSEPRQNKDRIRYLNRALNRQVDFIAGLPGIGSGAAAEIRIVSTPAPNAPQCGKIRVALRLRATADTADLARERVIEATLGLHPNLAAISDAYQWRPITSAEDYQERFTLPVPLHAAELLRREAVLPLDRLRRLPPKRSIGFLATDETPRPATTDPTDVYFVFPYVRTFSSLKTLFDILLMQAHPVLISLAVAPTRIENAEIELLRNQVERCESYLHQERRYPDDLNPVATPLRHRANQLLEALHRFTFSLLDDCFRMRVTVASPAPVPAGLMEALGTTVTESVNSQDPYSDASPETQHLMGGQDWVAASARDQRAAAMENLESIGFNVWVASLAPRVRSACAIWRTRGKRMPSSGCRSPRKGASRGWRHVWRGQFPRRRICRIKASTSATTCTAASDRR